MMYCAECGSQMSKSYHGAWKLCCNGVGYWFTSKPLPSDNWWPVTHYKNYTFYPSVNWPKNKSPANPRTAQ